MSAPFIPPKTADKMNGEHPKGTRHQAAIEIAIPLIGNGLSPSAVFSELRARFDADVTDKELEDIVVWAERANPTPSGFGERRFNGNGGSFRRQSSTPKPPERTPLEQARWWLSNEELTPEQLTERSPFNVPESNAEAALLTFELLYDSQEFVNLVRDFTTDADDPNKTRPQGGGKILRSEEWQQWIRTNGVPQSQAGCWIRFNPCSRFGSGSSGAVTDDDIFSHRYLLVESDVLPLPIQLALYSKLRLPIAVIHLSGGKSAHAWVKVDAQDEKEYKERADKILALLKPFGVDPANKNPSRLSRLPGARRVIGAEGDGIQKMLWINNNPAALNLAQFEISLSGPVPEERPFRRAIIDAATRYEELVANRGNLGVLTGIADFDRDTGGFKGGQMTVIAAETNGGKSTVAINFINGALQRGSGVLLFTLEMDKDEICDLIVSMNCDVNRNCFNTGNFTEDDLNRIGVAAPRMSAMPLWVEDAPTMTVAQIRNRVVQLKTDGRIALVVIDYVQIINPEDARDPREQQVAKIAREIRALAKEVKLPFIVLSQLNDDGKLRESRVVAHEAHNVILLEADEQTSPATMKMKVVKGRRIPKRNYDLLYFPEFCRVASASHQPQTE